MLRTDDAGRFEKRKGTKLVMGRVPEGEEKKGTWWYAVEKDDSGSEEKPEEKLQIIEDLVHVTDEETTRYTNRDTALDLARGDALRSVGGSGVSRARALAITKVPFPASPEGLSESAMRWASGFHETMALDFAPARLSCIFAGAKFCVFSKPAFLTDDVEPVRMGDIQDDPDGAPAIGSPKNFATTLFAIRTANLFVPPPDEATAKRNFARLLRLPHGACPFFSENVLWYVNTDGTVCAVYLHKGVGQRCKLRIPRRKFATRGGRKLEDVKVVHCSATDRGILVLAESGVACRIGIPPSLASAMDPPCEPLPPIRYDITAEYGVPVSCFMSADGTAFFGFKTGCVLECGPDRVVKLVEPAFNYAAMALHSEVVRARPTHDKLVEMLEGCKLRTRDSDGVVRTHEDSEYFLAAHKKALEKYKFKVSVPKKKGIEYPFDAVDGIFSKREESIVRVTGRSTDGVPLCISASEDLVAYSTRKGVWLRLRNPEESPLAEKWGSASRFVGVPRVESLQVSGDVVFAFSKTLSVLFAIPVEEPFYHSAVAVLPPTHTTGVAPMSALGGVYAVSTNCTSTVCLSRQVYGAGRAPSRFARVRVEVPYAVTTTMDAMAAHKKSEGHFRYVLSHFNPLNDPARGFRMVCERSMFETGVDGFIAGVRRARLALAAKTALSATESSPADACALPLEPLHLQASRSLRRGAVDIESFGGGALRDFVEREWGTVDQIMRWLGENDPATGRVVYPHVWFLTAEEATEKDVVAEVVELVAAAMLLLDGADPEPVHGCMRPEVAKALEAVDVILGDEAPSPAGGEKPHSWVHCARLMDIERATEQWNRLPAVFPVIEHPLIRWKPRALGDGSQPGRLGVSWEYAYKLCRTLRRRINSAISANMLQ